jgi:hypothetical protein
VTEHGSPPGRPRGRRARQDGSGPDWRGFDETPQDQREFPDLAPIRPREARPRDGRGPGDWQQQAPPEQPGLGLPGGSGGEYPGGAPAGPGYPPAAQAQPDAGYGQYGSGQHGAGQYDSGPYGNGGQHGAGQYGAGQHGTGQYGGGGYPEGGYPAPAAAGQPGQAPWDEHAWPGQQAPVHPDDQTWAGQPAYPPAGPYPSAAAAQAAANPVAPVNPVTTVPPGQSQRQQVPDEDVPSWAEPDSVEAFSARWHRRGLDSRDDRRGTRRTRRRLLIAVGATVAVVIGATAYLLSGGPGAANLGFGNFVTTFLPGELQQVPDACTAVPQTLLNQTMPGKLKRVAPPLNSGPNSACTWTLDSAPTYKVLQVSLVAYSPSGLASGDGSATFAAEDAYQTTEAGFQNPGPDSGQPIATVTDLSGMPGGTDTSSFEATQVFSRGGAITDVITVEVRYRNVTITVVVDGLDQSGSGSSKKYGPVQMSDLTATGKTVAQQVASQVVK